MTTIRASARPSPVYIEYALRRKAKVIPCLHLGRPKGKPNATMSLRPVVDRLRVLIDHLLGEDENVAFSPDCIGEVAEEMSRQLESGQTLLLENLRFHAEWATTRPSPKSSPHSAMSISTTPSAPRTAPTLPPKASPTSSSSPQLGC